MCIKYFFDKAREIHFVDLAKLRFKTEIEKDVLLEMFGHGWRLDVAVKVTQSILTFIQTMT